MSIYDFPLTDVGNLHIVQSCNPSDPPLPQATISRINNVLYLRLMKKIPEGNDAIQDITLPFAQKTDGYGLLYSIMRQSLPWMTTNKGGWSKRKWTQDMSARRICFDNPTRSK